MHTVRLFGKFIKYRFFAKTEYPRSYAAGIIAQWLSYGIRMFMLYLMVWNFGALVGWLPNQVLFLFAVQLMSYALGASFTFNICAQFAQTAIDGTLDEALVRPMPSLIYMMGANYNVDYISHITLTGIVLAVSTSQLGVSWSVMHWVWFVVMIISGAAIQACMMLLCEMPALRLRSKSPIRLFFWEGVQFTNYPLSIYPRPIQFIFTTVLPFAFIGFYPAQVLLGKRDGLFAEVAVWLAPVVAAALIFITALVWRKVISRYESAGT